MNRNAIDRAAQYIAEQIQRSMEGLAKHQAEHQIYVFALEITDDFAIVNKAANSESHYQASAGGPYYRWTPAEWFATGMDFDPAPIQELLGDPTFQVDPILRAQVPAIRAAWVMALIESLKVARAAGTLQSHGRPVVAFCTVQDSEFAGWLAHESAKQVNPPEVDNTLLSEISAVWEGWEEVGEEFAPVVAAYTTFRGH